VKKAKSLGELSDVDVNSRSPGTATILLDKEKPPLKVVDLVIQQVACAEQSTSSLRRIAPVLRLGSAIPSSRVSGSRPSGSTANGCTCACTTGETFSTARRQIPLVNTRHFRRRKGGRTRRRLRPYDI
jgi:hypothetical protein